MVTYSLVLKSFIAVSLCVGVSEASPPGWVRLNGPSEMVLGRETTFHVISTRPIVGPLLLLAQKASSGAPRALCSDDYQEVERGPVSLLHEYQITIARGFEDGHGCRGWAFTEAGDYELRVSISGIESSPVAVQVHPLDEEEQGWFLELARHPAAIDIIAGRDVVDIVGSFGVDETVASVRVLSEHQRSFLDKVVEDSLNRIRHTRIGQYKFSDDIVRRLKVVAR